MPPRLVIASWLEHITTFGLKTTLTTHNSIFSNSSIQYHCIIGQQVVVSNNDLYTCSAASELIPRLFLLDLLLKGPACRLWRYFQSKEFTTLL